MIKVSVIVPVYNVGKYLRRCVDSILGQSYENLEIILVDDGSTDSSGKICDEYGIQYSRIKVVHKRNGGLSSARNAGLDAASGNFVAFVDADDYIHPDMYRCLVEVHKKTNAEIISCNFQMINEGEQPQDVDANNTDASVYEGEEKYDQLWERDAQTVVQWSKFFCSKIFDHIRYPEGRIHEDVYVIHRELEACNKYAFVDIPFYYYVQHDKSIMHSEGFGSVNDAIEGYEDRARFFHIQGLEKYKTRTLRTLFEYISWRFGLMIDSGDKDGSRLLQEKARLLLRQYEKDGVLSSSEMLAIKNMRLNKLYKSMGGALLLKKLLQPTT